MENTSDNGSDGDLSDQLMIDECESAEDVVCLISQSDSDNEMVRSGQCRMLAQEELVEDSRESFREQWQPKPKDQKFLNVRNRGQRSSMIMPTELPAVGAISLNDERKGRLWTRKELTVTKHKKQPIQSDVLEDASENRLTENVGEEVSGTPKEELPGCSNVNDGTCRSKELSVANVKDEPALEADSSPYEDGMTENVEEDMQGTSLKLIDDDPLMNYFGIDSLKGKDVAICANGEKEENDEGLDLDDTALNKMDNTDGCSDQPLELGAACVPTLVVNNPLMAYNKLLQLPRFTSTMRQKRLKKDLRKERKRQVNEEFEQYKAWALGEGSNNLGQHAASVDTPNKTRRLAEHSDIILEKCDNLNASSEDSEELVSYLEYKPRKKSRTGVKDSDPEYKPKRKSQTGVKDSDPENKPKRNARTGVKDSECGCKEDEIVIKSETECENGESQETKSESVSQLIDDYHKEIKSEVNKEDSNVLLDLRSSVPVEKVTEMLSVPKTKKQGKNSKSKGRKKLPAALVERVKTLKGKLDANALYSDVGLVSEMTDSPIGQVNPMTPMPIDISPEDDVVYSDPSPSIVNEKPASYRPEIACTSKMPTALIQRVKKLQKKLDTGLLAKDGLMSAATASVQPIDISPVYPTCADFPALLPESFQRVSPQEPEVVEVPDEGENEDGDVEFEEDASEKRCHFFHMFATSCPQRGLNVTNVLDLSSVQEFVQLLLRMIRIQHCDNKRMTLATNWQCLLDQLRHYTDMLSRGAYPITIMMCRKHYGMFARGKKIDARAVCNLCQKEISASMLRNLMKHKLRSPLICPRHYNMMEVMRAFYALKNLHFVGYPYLCYGCTPKIQCCHVCGINNKTRVRLNTVIGFMRLADASLYNLSDFVVVCPDKIQSILDIPGTLGMYNLLCQTCYQKIKLFVKQVK